jgi:hypothetical protein
VLVGIATKRRWVDLRVGEGRQRLHFAIPDIRQFTADGVGESGGKVNLVELMKRPLNELRGDLTVNPRT